MASNFTKSVLKAATIFKNPPNPSPPFKEYEGKTIRENRDLDSILYEIKKHQGMRRFKIANLKDRHPLYESDILQIGYKTYPIHD